MKLRTFSLAIATLAAGVAPTVAFAADEGPTVYGKFNIGLDNQKDEIGLDSGTADSRWEMQDQNNSSRLGVKGAKDIGVPDLSVVYRLEYGIDPDGSEGSAFSERNIYAGLKHARLGEVWFGKFDTPLKSAGAKSDFFNDESIGDITRLMVGETRANDMIQYMSPKIGGLVTATVALQPGEGRTALDDAADTEDGIADTIYASLGFENKLINAYLAYANNEKSGLKFDGATAGVDILRAAIATNPIGGFEFGALYQNAQGISVDNSVDYPVAGDAEENSWLVSAAYNIQALKLKAQYGQTDGDQSDVKRSELALGIDYTVSKALMAQVYYIKYEDKDGVGTAASGAPSDPETTSYGVAMIVNF